MHNISSLVCCGINIKNHASSRFLSTMTNLRVIGSSRALSDVQRRKDMTNNWQDLVFNSVHISCSSSTNLHHNAPQVYRNSTSTCTLLHSTTSSHVFMITGRSTRRNQKQTIQSCQQQNATARLMDQKPAQGNCWGSSKVLSPSPSPPHPPQKKSNSHFPKKSNNFKFD